MTAARQAIRALLQALLETGLPRNQRLLLMLYADERDFSLREIAQVLGVDEDQVVESLKQFIDAVRRGGAA